MCGRRGRQAGERVAEWIKKMGTQKCPSPKEEAVSGGIMENHKEKEQKYFLMHLAYL